MQPEILTALAGLTDRQPERRAGGRAGMMHACTHAYTQGEAKASSNDIDMRTKLESGGQVKGHRRPIVGPQRRVGVNVNQCRKEGKDGTATSQTYMQALL